MKKIVLALAFVLLGSFMISGCSKDEILDHYNNIVQSAGAIELTGKLSLEGTKEKGIDDYTGTYTADYENFSDIEYLFGGTSIKREIEKGHPAPAYGRYQNVFLTDGELADLQASFPTVWGQYIEKLSEYMASTGKRYQSHAATIRRWACLLYTSDTAVNWNIGTCSCSLVLAVVISAILILCMKEREATQTKKKAKKVAPKKGW